MTRFHKMHGLGNDFAIFEARDGAIAMDAARARAIADRHTGIGCDQVILLEYDQSDRLSWVLSQNEDRTYALEMRVRHAF